MPTRACVHCGKGTRPICGTCANEKAANAPPPDERAKRLAERWADVLAALAR